MSEQEEDWPYEKIDVASPDAAPSWLCPETICNCSEKEGKTEPYEFAIMLCKPTGERMAGARCRVVVNGILANEDHPNADGSGWMRVKLPHAPESVEVEWAPEDTPMRPDLPYRRRYFVDLQQTDPNEAARRRLHNLGFSWFDSLKENIEDFQVEYKQPKITGDVEDVDATLRAYHDAAMLPITEDKKAKQEDTEASPNGFQLVRGPGNPVAQPPPAPAGGGGPTGTVKPPLSRKTNLASILDIIDQNKHSFEWIAVQTSEGGFDGMFWVFKDALKEKSSGRRWPTSPHEQQIACTKLQSKPSDLPNFPTEATSSGGSEDSVFLTPKLMDIRWAQAEKAGQAIEPRGQNINGDTAVENDKLNKWVDSQMKAGWTAADPGKIWAIVNRMAGVKIAGLPAAVNYGWHLQSTKVTVSKTNAKEGTWGGGPVKQAATPAGQWCVQWEEMGHNTAWIDYSQLLILAAGWCCTRTTGSTSWTAERTKDVYKDPNKAALVTADKKPLTITEQPVPALSQKTAANQLKLEQDLAERRFRTARIEERKQADSKDPGAGPGGDPGPMTA